jgi:hypothetical protein
VKGRALEYSSLILKRLVRNDHQTAKALAIHRLRRLFVAIHAIPVKYLIRFEKDHSSVKASYDLSVPVGGAALIAAFQVSVDGTDLIGSFLPGQTRFNGAHFHTLSQPDRDATVSFSISSNEGWTASDSDVLRGSKTYDDAEFSD